MTIIDELTKDVPASDTSAENDTSSTYDQWLEKYKDNDGIAKALSSKEEFIGTIKSENEQLRDTVAELLERNEQLSTKSQTADLLKAVKEQTNNQSDFEGLNHSNPTQTIEDNIGDNVVTNETDTPQSAYLTADEAEDVFNRIRAEEQAEANQKAAINKLKEMYGDAAGKALDDTMSKNGLDANVLTGLAKSSPDALVSLVKGAVGAPSNNGAPYSPSSLNSDAVSRSRPQTDAQGLWDEDMKAFKENPTDVAIRERMIKRQMEYGADYGPLD